MEQNTRVGVLEDSVTMSRGRTTALYATHGNGDRPQMTPTSVKWLDLFVSGG